MAGTTTQRKRLSMRGSAVSASRVAHRAGVAHRVDVAHRVGTGPKKRIRRRHTRPNQSKAVDEPPNGPTTSQARPKTGRNRIQDKLTHTWAISSLGRPQGQVLGHALSEPLALARALTAREARCTESSDHRLKNVAG